MIVAQFWERTHNPHRPRRCRAHVGRVSTKHPARTRHVRADKTEFWVVIRSGAKSANRRPFPTARFPSECVAGLAWRTADSQES